MLFSFILTCYSQDPCDPINNPTGYIALCIPENKLITRMIAERCLDSGSSAIAFSDSSVYCYNNFSGTQLAREAAAYFLARRFLFTDEPMLPPSVALQNIQPDHIVINAGTASILSNLFFVLGEQTGDACLIPAPYYAAFESDMHLIPGVIPFPVEQANRVQGPQDEELEKAYRQATLAGLRPRFLLLTNPNNPLAVIYKPEVIIRAVRWARKHKLHTIVDELYALSTHLVRFSSIYASSNQIATSLNLLVLFDRNMDMDFVQLFVV